MAFCRRVSPRHSPAYVGAEHVAGMRTGMCFHNVRSLCEIRGGTIEYGWLIWEWADTFLEAEHHAVWKIDEERVEVTPRTPHHAQVLFLPQPDKAFDFMHCRRRDNIRAALRADAAVREYLALAARTVAIEETNSIGAEVSLAPEDCCELDRIRSRMSEIERSLALWSIARLGRNDACWCGSGRKLKKCCTRSDAGMDRAAGSAAHSVRLPLSPDSMS